MEVRRGERDIRHIAGAIGRHSESSLPCRLGVERAGAATGSVNPLPHRFARGRVVPCCFRNVGCGGPSVGAVSGAPESSRSVVELGAAHGGDLRDAGRKANGRTVDRDIDTIVAVERSAIPRRSQPGDALQIRLLSLRSFDRRILRFALRLAVSKTLADDRCQVVVDGVERRLIRTAPIYVDERRIRRHRAGPFQVHVRFLHVVDGGSRVAGIWVEYYLRAKGRQIVLGAKPLNVGGVDAALAYDDDTLPGAVDVRLMQPANVVDGGQVVRGQGVRSIARREGR